MRRVAVGCAPAIIAIRPCETEVCQGEFVARIERDGTIEIGDGARTVALRAERQSAPVESLGAVRTALHRFVELGNRTLIVAPVEPGGAAQRMQRRVVGFERECVIEIRERPIRVVFPKPRRPARAKAVGILGRETDVRAEIGDGAVILGCAEEREAAVVECRRSIWIQADRVIEIRERSLDLALTEPRDAAIVERG